jgi:hypothetical protein
MIDGGEPYFGLNVAAARVGLTRAQFDTLLFDTRAGETIQPGTLFIRNLKDGGERPLLSEFGIRSLTVFRRRYKGVDWDDPPEHVMMADLFSKSQRYRQDCAHKQWLAERDLSQLK